MDMFQNPHESPVILCVGQKGGGKSFRTMTMIMWLLHNNIYDRYLFILPTYHFESANSYAWLMPFKDRVFISTEYTPELSLAFMQREDDRVAPHEMPRTFLWLDDVGCNESFRCDRQFVSLLSIARHKRLSVCLCFHSLTSGHTLSPFLRQNVTHTLLFRVTNEKLLENLYEELISMTGQFERFRDFKYVYNQHTCSEVNATTGEVTKNFNGLCINNSLGCVDWKVVDWFQKETDTLKSFLEQMDRMLEAQELPPPIKNDIDLVDAKVISDVRPKPIPLVDDAKWQQIEQAVQRQPELFLYNPIHRRHWTKVMGPPPKGSNRGMTVSQQHTANATPRR